MHQATLPLPPATAPTAAASPSTYGAQVFAQLQPLFERSCCVHYRVDFFKHDRRSLEGCAVPGLGYLWAIRPMGTHLVTLGFKDNTEVVKAILRESDPAYGQIYHVTVTESGCVAKAVDVARALVLAGTKPMLTMVGHRAPFGSVPTLYVFSRNGSQIATVTVSVRYDRERNCTLADVVACIPDHLDRLVRVHVALLLEDACTAEAGSLFWTPGRRTVNEEPFEQWAARITRVPRPSK